MQNMWINLIYVFDTFFHISYVKTAWDSGIKLLELRIRINFKLWSCIKSTWDLCKTIILRFSYLLIAFEDLNSFMLLTYFLYKNSRVLTYFLYENSDSEWCWKKSGSWNLDRIPGKCLWRISIFIKASG